MSRKRLHKSSDIIISGVCGGIAEYFGIDATLVRIIAVALTIVGMGIPAIVYVICMIALPPDPGTAQGYVNAHAETTASQCRVDCSGFNSEAGQAPPDPAARVSAPFSAIGDARTVSGDNAEPNKSYSSSVLVIGAVLIGVGTIALLSNFVHISLWRFWPVVLVVVGLVCLFTPSPRGWSLIRAGNSIVLITLGVALLAWMLQIIHLRIILDAFFDLWPMLLVVAGLSIIGSARKSSIITLMSSLMLSATIIFGLWVYGGLDWAHLSTTAWLMDSDGFNEIISDVTLRR